MIRKWSFAVCCELSFAAAGVSPYCVFARTVHQFCRNNTILFPTGGAAAPPVPPPRTLMWLDLTSEHDINKKNRGIFWRWIRHCARKRSAAKIFPKLTQVSLLVGYQNFVASVWYQIKAFCCEAPSARERSPIAKKIWLFIYPRSFGWHLILRPPVPALRPHLREANVKCHTF